MKCFGVAPSASALPLPGLGAIGCYRFDRSNRLRYEGSGEFDVWECLELP